MANSPEERVPIQTTDGHSSYEEYATELRSSMPPICRTSAKRSSLHSVYCDAAGKEERERLCQKIDTLEEEKVRLQKKIGSLEKEKENHLKDNEDMVKRLKEKDEQLKDQEKMAKCLEEKDQQLKQLRKELKDVCKKKKDIENELRK